MTEYNMEYADRGIQTSKIPSTDKNRQEAWLKQRKRQNDFPQQVVYPKRAEDKLVTCGSLRKRAFVSNEKQGGKWNPH